MALLRPKYSFKAIAYLVGGKQVICLRIRSNYIFP